MKDLAICLFHEHNATSEYIDNYYRVNYEGVFAVINVLPYAHTYKLSMCLLCYT